LNTATDAALKGKDESAAGCLDEAGEAVAIAVARWVFRKK
jgi:hypothetical protein